MTMDSREETLPEETVRERRIKYDARCGGRKGGRKLLFKSEAESGAGVAGPLEKRPRIFRNRRPDAGRHRKKSSTGALRVRADLVEEVREERGTLTAELFSSSSSPSELPE